MLTRRFMPAKLSHTGGQGRSFYLSADVGCCLLVRSVFLAVDVGVGIGTWTKAPEFFLAGVVESVWQGAPPVSRPGTFVVGL